MNTIFECDAFAACLEEMCGSPCPHRAHIQHLPKLLGSIQQIGYSQFNELLLFLGFESICAEFFDYLCTGTISQNPKGQGPRIQNMAELRAMVERSQRLSLLAFGNVKFGFKKFSRNADVMEEFIGVFSPITASRYLARIPPAIPVVNIPPDERYYLGYLIQAAIKERLQSNPDDQEAKAQYEKAQAVIQRGEDNQSAYLTSDYLDVYVATSMREQHEFAMVAEFTTELFAHSDIQPLNLRYFDPTLAYCEDRIDKGLSEALMLKRAKCTIFLAQESDTLGKDSELASTLAQGKAVIAYVPSGDKNYVAQLLQMLKQVYREKSKIKLMLDQLMVIAPQLAWKDPKIKAWLSDETSINETELLEFFQVLIEKHYDKRAQLLRGNHPLGIQVNLQTGVAVGVLVVRNIASCAALLKRIMLGECTFEVENKSTGNAKHLILKEEISESIFRVMTYDPLLTHAFWNSYLK